MSKTHRKFDKQFEGSRPQHQLERGERYGNQWHQQAELKKRARRNERARQNAEMDVFDDAEPMYTMSSDQ